MAPRMLLNSDNAREESNSSEPHSSAKYLQQVYQHCHAKIDVPTRMWLSASLRQNLRSVYQIGLQPLNCSFGVVTEKAERPLRYCVKKEQRSKQASATVVFVVRRPGCNSCREHGQQLVQLVESEAQVALMAVVKEVGVEEQGILEFYEEYFHYPIYKDPAWKVYRAMGDRRLSIGKLLKRGLAAQGRWSRKGIRNRLKGGDIWVQGGVLVFDRKRRLQFAYEEEYGKQLDVEDIRAAIEAVRRSEEDTTTDAWSEDMNMDP